jgi:UDP-N-acetylglucosamine:LPS N-acetylglucosamine transferase
LVHLAVQALRLVFLVLKFFMLVVVVVLAAVILPLPLLVVEEVVTTALTNLVEMDWQTQVAAAVQHKIQL